MDKFSIYVTFIKYIFKTNFHSVTFSSHLPKVFLTFILHQINTSKQLIWQERLIRINNAAHRALHVALWRVQTCNTHVDDVINQAAFRSLLLECLAFCLHTSVISRRVCTLNNRGRPPELIQIRHLYKYIGIVI